MGLAGANEIRLVRADLPALCRVASSISAGGQRRVILLTAVLLGCGLGSGILAQFGGKDGPSWHAWADIGTAALFVGTAVGGALLNGGRAHARWYDGRVAAESAKTLSWKYAMGVAQLADDTTADQDFLKRLDDIRSLIGRLSRTPRSHHWALLDRDVAISPAMRALRDAPVPTKRAVYHEYRLRDQITWYSTKAADADRKARIWQTVSVLLGTIGFGGAILRALGLLDLDALGLAATFIASITAWTELRQYLTNAAAYRLTVRELLVIEEELLAIETEAPTIANDANRWRTFCERAEYAISREHTMWHARAS